MVIRASYHPDWVFYKEQVYEAIWKENSESLYYEYVRTP